MPKNVKTLRSAHGRDDHAQAAEIFAFVHALHQANRPDIYRKTNVPLGEDEFFKMCDDPHEIMLLCGARRQNLGVCPHGDAGKCRGCGYFAACAGGYGGAGRVAAGWGMGIGTALLYASEAEAKRRGAESLELMVWSFNKSEMRFYESAGMTVRSLVMEKEIVSAQVLCKLSGGRAGGGDLGHGVSGRWSA